MPNEVKASQGNTALAVRAHAVNLEYIHAVKSVTVRDVTCPINTYYLKLCGAALQDSVRLQCRGSFDKSTVDFEVCINSANLEHGGLLIGLIAFLRVGPWRDKMYLGAFASVEFVEWMSRAITLKLLEEVLDGKAYLAAHHLLEVPI